MRRLEASAMRHPVAGLVLAALLAGPLAGCSRLSFVKADPNRGDYTQVAPDYRGHETREEKRSTLALSLAAAAGEALQAGRLDVARAQAEKALDNDRNSSEAHTVLALEIDKDNPIALAGMARYSYGTGDYLQARAFSERRLAAAAATVEVLLLASQIEQKLGDSAASALYVQRLRNEFPQSQTPRGDVGQQ